MKDFTAPLYSRRKQTIARHFAHARDYDEHASIQQQVCQSLLARIARTQQDSVLEIGAGSGQLTRLITAAIQSRHWLINELCPQQQATLQSISPAASIAIGDAETMDLACNHSLIISANAIQWFDNPLHIINQSADRLIAGGQLLFNTFTPNNFLQIKTLTGQGLHYPEAGVWQQALAHAGFEKIAITSERFDVTFATPYAVLKHMKLTGVSTNQTHAQTSHSEPFIWTKTRLQQFERDYWQHFSAKHTDGTPCVYLTYEVLMVSAFKA